MNRIAVTFLLVCLLGACDKTDNAAAQPETAAPESLQAAADTATIDGNAQPAQPARPDEDEDVAATQESDKREKKTAKLNLSLPENLSATDAGVQEQEERVLPDMFARQESRTKVSGGVKRDAENPDLINSVNGAEVSVEFKTD